MASQRILNGVGGIMGTELHDSVFEPGPDFDFEEEPGHMMPQAYHHPGDFALYDDNMQSAFGAVPSEHQQGSNAVPRGHWQNPYQQDFAAGTVMSSSAQAEIINNRADSVTQVFGQITPPDTDSTNSRAVSFQQAQECEAAKRKERARNAANKRHAKSKNTRTASGSSGANGAVEDATEDRGERQAHYREKNRVAAAKCRAKKKNHNDHLEEIHRGEAVKNRLLKAELMGLRNELAQLKGLTLEHGPDSCQCHGIYEYSMRQASLIARGAAPQYGPSLSSPSRDSSRSADTPISEATGASLRSVQEPMSPAMGNWMQSS